MTDDTVEAEKLKEGTTRILGLFSIESTSAFEADLMDDINVGASKYL